MENRILAGLTDQPIAGGIITYVKGEVEFTSQTNDLYTVKMGYNQQEQKIVFICNCQKQGTASCKHVAGVLAKLCRDQCNEAKKLTYGESFDELIIDIGNFNLNN